jgi:hypothetical protein
MTVILTYRDDIVAMSMCASVKVWSFVLAACVVEVRSARTSSNRSSAVPRRQRHATRGEQSASPWRSRPHSNIDTLAKPQCGL